MAAMLRDDLLNTYHANKDNGPYQIDAKAIGRRSLKNCCLEYLVQIEGQTDMLTLCLEQFWNADNMTDELGALRVLANQAFPERNEVLQHFYQRWQHEPLVVDKWFALQANVDLVNALEQVKSLMQHQAFNIKNPNKVRALIGTFCHHNPVHFHAIDGSGYIFLADQVIALNILNPQIAARLLSALNRWRKYDEPRQAMMHRQLERILATPSLSPDVYEIATKSIGNT
jgi:aminopeptidase N